MLADYLSRRQLELADEEQMPPQLPPFVALSDAGAEKLFAGSGTTYAQARAAADRGEIASRELKATAKIKIKFKSAKVAGSNVVGYLEGSDPALKSEAVVYTAHYDAWGLGGDGRLFHGAADNALGVAEMIAVAEVMLAAKERPRRSVIFLALTGEEYGGYGGEYWVKKPTWDIKKVAADFNFDGVGTEIYGPLKKIVGFGAEHSDLGATLQAVAAASNDAVVPDPMPEEKSFYRSDHYAFVKKGVPALMLMGAPDITKEALVARIKDYEKRAYHLPADVIQPDWNWEGPRGLAQVGLVVGLRVANADAMPAWLTSSPFNRKRGTNEPPPPEP
jgi:Zn-dependent M28 family amino/carboxypeptidase